MSRSAETTERVGTRRIGWESYPVSVRKPSSNPVYPTPNTPLFPLERVASSISPEQPDQLALNLHAIWRQDAHLVAGVGGLERDRGAAAAEALERRLLLVDQSDDDVAGVGGFGAADERDVAVEDAGVDHGIAAHFEREMIAGRKQVGRHVDGVAAVLDRLDRRAGGDAAHHRNGDRAAALVLGIGAHPPEVALDDVRREAAAAPADAVGDRIRKPDHFDRARSVGQPPDEAALLERGDQPVNAGFRAQVERVLHLVEGGGNAALLEPLVNEPQQFQLLARQHRCPARRWLSLGNARPKQSMNGRYLFFMCSATI